MKFMETINKLQAALTELRREVQRSEAPKVGGCIVCGFKHPKLHPAFGTGIPKDVSERLSETEEDTLEDQIRRCNETFIAGYRKKLDREIKNELKTAGECTKCAKIETILEERIHGNMPDCQCGICMRVVDVIWPDKEPDLTPDLPLHVKVALALGHKVEWVKASGKIGYWSDRCCTADMNIPDYPNDLVAAMGALEEYCETYNWSINCWIEFGYYEVKIAETEYLPVKGLPQAICEAIVAHSEGK